MRHTRGHTNNRRSHHALAAIGTVAGEKGVTLPHRVDEATGLYRGKQIASPAKIKKTEAQKHDHPHGTHHEHVARDERDPSTIAESQTAGVKPGEAANEPRENL
jgi:ribosomal protein L32